MSQFLSKEDHHLLTKGFCPCCHHTGFILGPRAGMACNALCPHCRREYNISRFTSETINCVCPIEHQRDIYHLVPVPIEDI